MADDALAQYIATFLEQQKIIQLLRGFALAKTLATNARILNRCDLLFEPWVTTSVDVVENLDGSGQLDDAIKAEVAIVLERLKQYAHTPADCITFMANLDKARGEYFRTYQGMLDSHVKINKDAAFWLTFGLAAASTARVAADVALTWMGLLSGPATIGFDLAKKRFIIFATGEGAALTKAFIFKKFGIAMLDGVGCTIAENASAVRNTDLLVVGKSSLATNAPGLLNDLFLMVVQFFNNRSMARIQAALKDAEAKKAQVNQQIKLARAKGEKTAALNADRRALKVQVSQGRAKLQAQEVVPEKAVVTTGQAVLKTFAYGLSFLSTEQSLVRFYRNLNGEIDADNKGYFLTP